MKNKTEKSIQCIRFKKRAENIIKSKILMIIFSFVFLCFWRCDASAANWYRYGSVIHACGTYKGYEYTNSREALLNTLQARKHQRTLPIEIDFMLTSDGIPVCAHDWPHFNQGNGISSQRRLSIRQFKQSHTVGGFTPMTAKEAIDILAKSHNAYLIVDTKENNLKIYKKLVQVCKKTGHSAFLKRIIIQLYHFEDYKRIKKIYRFRHWLFSAYKVGHNKPKQIKAIVKKAQKLKLDALVMPYTSFSVRANNTYRIINRNIQAVNKNRRIPLIIHTINDENLYNMLRRYRINGIYTDNLNLW